jgi:Flp pilus assembly protein TadG
MRARGCGERRNSVCAAVSSTEASQLLEFAVALPFLVVLVVGIFDFGGAFNLKHQLGNAVRDGARFGTTLSLDDVTLGTLPASVNGAWQLVDSYLVRSEINDCGLGSAVPIASPATYTWTSTANSSPCTGNLTLTIERAYMFHTSLNNVTTDVLCTHVTISYPYQWHFGTVIQLLAPGTTYGATIPVAADAVMPNMN